MADLYPPNSYPIRQQQPYHRPQDSNQQYPINNDLVYPPTLISSSSTSTNGSDQNFDSPQSAQKSPDQSQPQQQSQQPAQPKTESATGGGKPQATFLTKLYACVPRSRKCTSPNSQLT
ncbi:hypothetical protein JAAARDRAFT_238230 [Jaapia argillacea MUCL 33604]|uniref:Uncharacterized protein n=1 Tax=Jaapia argillacea MUCL 33604 TaxID=933084 RepID=A0A067QCL0_9AGAM|nr:hypothetical protein JAAARDRAFT_238230 [Jaapia argillacea MUCL 33604]